MAAHSIRGGQPAQLGRRSLCGAFAYVLLGASREAHAQLPEKVHRIGYLNPRATYAAFDEAFVQGMSDLGYVAGRNLIIEYRWAGNDLRKLQPMAEELVQLGVQVIVTATTAGTRAVMHATRTIPIVMAATADPVASGLIASLGRPGGNVTGMSLQTTEVARKRLELLRELVPGANRIALLAEQVTGPTQGTTKALVDETTLAAKQLGVDLVVQEVANADRLVDAFANFRTQRVQGLIVQVSQLTLEHRGRIVEWAAREGLPAMYEARNFVTDGGLVSYGPDLRESYRRAATYVSRILKGAKPGDLPVEHPNKLELVINLKTARALGLLISPRVLVSADQVVQ